MSDIQNPLMRVSSNPHIRSKLSTDKIMLCVIIALMPATVFGIRNFGIHAFLQILLTVATCVAAEAIYELLMKKKLTVLDFSAALTGLLLALNMPPAAPLWVGPLGGIFAIIVVKMLFGGLGQNFMNPALAARCFLLISFPAIMTNFNCDAYTGATPLARIKAGEIVDVYDMILGKTAGTIGETSMIAIILGAALLLMTGVIDLRVPGSYIITFVIFYGLFGGHGFDGYYISAQLAGGGLMLGAFFMATDYVTRPVTKNGQIVYGIILGLLTGIFRVFGASSEGVSYAIIIGNMLSPFITKYTAPKAFGKGGERV